VAWIVDRIGWDTLKTQVAQWIDRLPPAATFLVFLVPVLLLLPLKVVGRWMLARGSWLGAMATLAFAKVVSMGVTAFIFDVTRPKLLQLAWFRGFYEFVLRWLAKAHALVDPLRAEMRAWAKRALAPLARRLRSLLWLMRPKRAGRSMRRLIWLRRRGQQQRAWSRRGLTSPG